MTVVSTHHPPPTLFFGTAQCYSEFFTILYCLLHGTVRLGDFVHNISNFLFFMLHTSKHFSNRFFLQLQVFHCSPKLFFTVWAIKMIYHLLLASHCSSCNTVTVSAFFMLASVHTMVQTMFFQSFRTWQICFPVYSGVKKHFLLWLKNFKSSATVNL